MCNVNESWLMDVHIVCYQVLIIVVPSNFYHKIIRQILKECQYQHINNVIFFRLICFHLLLYLTDTPFLAFA